MLRARWLIVAIGLLAASVAAACVRAYRYPAFVPRIVAHTLDQFIEPGLALWWLTLGGAFQSFPANWTGYCVTVLGNTMLWLASVILLVLVAGGARRRLFRRQHRASPAVVVPADRATLDP